MSCETAGELLTAEKYATVNWASHINMETGRPVLTEEGKFWQRPVGETAAIWPNMWGAHSWNPMAFHPGEGLVYIPVIDAPTVVWMHEDGSYGDTIELVTSKDGKVHAPGRLTAWDPVAQRAAWSVPHTLPFNGGVLATAGGLVFQGTASGDFAAYDAANGERLWRVATGSAINSAPVSFTSGEQQMILIAVGAGGGMQFVYPELHAADNLHGPTRVMAFSLDGESAIAAADHPAPVLPVLPQTDIAPEAAAYGSELYHDYCASCHGKNARARAGGSVPDLRYVTQQTHSEWPAIVIGGARESAGMPRSDLDTRDAEAIRLYVIQQARRLQ